ncbi:MAG: hypothetical protein HGA45_18205 [Chloroflexales bacterium]|nr:hypothetical protein [Chloroflexales bacterium]
MYQTEIHIKGRINPNWEDWFEGLEVQESAKNETILRGELPDMAAVYGVISRLGSLVITLISVNCVDLSDGHGLRTV